MALKRKKGQAIVEFAFVLPVFVLLMVGFLHMSLVIHDYLAMGEATREIARYAAVGTKKVDIVKKINVNDRLTNFYTIDVDKDLKINETTDDVVVTMTMNFNGAEKILITSAFMPNQLSTTLTMRKE